MHILDRIFVTVFALGSGLSFGKYTNNSYVTLGVFLAIITFAVCIDSIVTAINKKG